MNQPEDIKRVNVLGVGISAIHFDQALQIIDQWIAQKNSRYICVCGVHGVIESQNREDVLAAINGADLVTPDGMPMVWISHLFGYKKVTRVYGPDLMRAVCLTSQQKQYSHFLYGSTPETLEKLKKQLLAVYPDLIIRGSFSPPFRALTQDEDQQIIQMINQSGSDIIWVGLSTPKQELWMANHAHAFKHGILIGVGAAFDFVAGTKKQAPVWMQRSGLEWVFRLYSEPGRLWRRYLVNNPLFAFLFFLQLVGLKKYKLP